MKPLLLTALAVLAAASARAAAPAQCSAESWETRTVTPAPLLPPAEAYLRDVLKLDPAAPDVALAIADGVVLTTMDGVDPEQYSLNSLIMNGKKNGALAFIGTRNFIKRLQENFSGTSIPTTHYDPLYLTQHERGHAGCKYAERYKKKTP